MQKPKIRQRHILTTDNQNCSLHGVFCKLGLTNKHQPIAKPVIGSGLDKQY